MPTWKTYLSHIVFRRYIALGKKVPERINFLLVQGVFVEDQKIKENIRSLEGIQYLSLVDKLCDSDKNCLIRVGENLQEDLISIDYGHLSENGSIYIVKKYLGQEIDRLLKN